VNTGVAGRAGIATDSDTSVLGRLWLLFLVAVGLSVVVVGLYIGGQYYLTPFDERPFSDLYEKFRPTGSFGLRYGIVGLLLITGGVITYSSRKRIKWFARVGKLKYWLELHIFVCTVGPFLVTLHTSFKVGGLVSIAFWSMVVVALSGIFGRYVYVRIPKNVQGKFAGLAAVEKERAALVASLEADLGPRASAIERAISPGGRKKSHSLLGAIVAAVKFDFTRRSTVWRVKMLLPASVSPAKREHIMGLVRDQLELEHQIALAIPFQRLFRYWHLLHLPLAIAMFIIVIVHVTVATMFGYGFGS